MLNGFGVMEYSDGWVYEGEFKTDLKEGPGILTLPNGKTFKGVWSQDELQNTLKEENHSKIFLDKTESEEEENFIKN